MHKRSHFYVSEDNLLPQNDSCSFCKSESFKTIINVQLNPPINFVKCQNCYAVFPTRLPKEQLLSEYYASYYKNDHKFIKYWAPEKLIKNLISKLSQFSTLEELNILDIGGGDGTIAIVLAKKLISKFKLKRVNISLIDYHAKTTIISDNINVIAHLPSDPFPQTSMHIILASAIIEHLIEPIAVLEKSFNVLAPGGIFYARTPYWEKIFQIFQRLGLSLNTRFPEHLYDLGSEFWENLIPKLFPKTNLRLIRSKPSPVQTSFAKNFFKALVSTLLKLPHYLFGTRYKLVGGWEVIIKNACPTMHP